jgi:hypothetical protein
MLSAGGLWHGERLSVVRCNKGNYQSLDSDCQILSRNDICAQIRRSSRAPPAICVNESDGLGGTQGSSMCIDISVHSDIINIRIITSDQE